MLKVGDIAMLNNICAQDYHRGALVEIIGISSIRYNVRIIECPKKPARVGKHMSMSLRKISSCNFTNKDAKRFLKQN